MKLTVKFTVGRLKVPSTIPSMFFPFMRSVQETVLKNQVLRRKSSQISSPRKICIGTFYIKDTINLLCILFSSLLKLWKLKPNLKPIFQ